MVERDKGGHLCLRVWCPGQVLVPDLLVYAPRNPVVGGEETSILLAWENQRLPAVEQAEQG